MANKIPVINIPQEQLLYVGVRKLCFITSSPLAIYTVICSCGMLIIGVLRAAHSQMLHVDWWYPCSYCRNFISANAT